MSKFVSLKKNIDFRRLYRRGRTCVTPCVVVYALPNRVHIHRLGITAGKKVGGAVSRNRAKRRLRALFREFAAGDLAGERSFDFVIVARARAVDCPYDRLKKDFFRAVHEAAGFETNLDKIANTNKMV